MIFCLMKVLERASSRNLAKAQQTQMSDQEAYIGYIQGVKPDPQKTKAIINMPPPTQIKNTSKDFGYAYIFLGEIQNEFRQICKHTQKSLEVFFTCVGDGMLMYLPFEVITRTR